MKKRIFGMLLGMTSLVAAGVGATECYAPVNLPANAPTNNFTEGTCYDCFQGVRGAGKAFASKRLGACRNTPGGATTTYVFGFNYNSSTGTNTPVNTCFVNARTVTRTTLEACSLIPDADYSRTPVGACANANNWYLESHNF